MPFRLRHNGTAVLPSNNHIFTGKTSATFLLKAEHVLKEQQESPMLQPRGIFDKVKNIGLLDVLPAFLGINGLKGIGRHLGFPYSALRHMRTTSNWFDILLVEYGFKQTADAHFRNGTVLHGVTREGFGKYENARNACRNGRRYEASSDGTEFWFEETGRKVSFKLSELCTYAINEVFFLRAYEKLQVQDRMVLDIGANIGDTAIYFALRGASHVYALEPYPYTYNIAVQNAEANQLGGKITLINAGIAGRSGSITVDPHFRNSSSSGLWEFKSGRAVPLVTLGEFVGDYGLKDAALKMDCEGAERCALLATDSETLRNFSSIILEYHYGYRDISAKLRAAGFSVELLNRPSYGYNPLAPDPHFITGMLYAERQ